MSIQRKKTCMPLQICPSFSDNFFILPLFYFLTNFISVLTEKYHRICKPEHFLTDI
jgi:hypothetical protein